MIPISTQEIHGVHGAEVVVVFTYDEDPFFDVHLLTEHGSVPLNSSPSIGPSSKYDVADKINNFVRSDTKDNLTIIDPGAFNAECFFALLVPPILGILIMIALAIFPAQGVAHL